MNLGGGGAKIFWGPISGGPNFFGPTLYGGCLF